MSIIEVSKVNKRFEIYECPDSFKYVVRDTRDGVDVSSHTWHVDAEARCTDMNRWLEQDSQTAKAGYA